MKIEEMITVIEETEEGTVVDTEVDVVETVVDVVETVVEAEVGMAASTKHQQQLILILDQQIPSFQIISR
jgi:hypothetical protein